MNASVMSTLKCWIKAKQFHHSYLNASTGFILAALYARYTPATRHTIADIPKPTIIIAPASICGNPIRPQEQ